MKTRKLIFGIALWLAINLILLQVGSSSTTIKAATPEPTWPGRGDFLIIPSGEIVSCDSPSAVTQCADGTCSTSTGSGTCSSHGGVAGVVDDNDDSSTIQSSPSDDVEPTPLPTVAPEAVAPEPPPANPPPAPEEVPASGGVLASKSNGTVLVMSTSVLLLMVAAALKATRSL